MKKLSRSFQTALYSLTLFSASLFCVESNVTFAINEYEIAARSGDASHYTQACDHLITAAQKSTLNDAYYCWKTTSELYPLHNHGHRIMAYLCSTGFWPLVNTITHTLSLRGDTTPCAITSVLTGVEAGSTGLLATVYALAAIVGISMRQEAAIIPALGAISLSTISTLQWTSLYLNITGSKSKTALDRTYKSLLRALDAVIREKQSSITIHQDSYVVEIQVQ